MSKARDVRYGRRGGRWLDHRPGQLLAELHQLKARLAAQGRPVVPVDRSRLFHPDTIAAARAHDQLCARSHKPGEVGGVGSGPAVLAAVWAGRARMARARRDAGVPLDAVDIEALRVSERGGQR